MIARSLFILICLATVCACQTAQPISGSDLVADAKTRITEVDATSLSNEPGDGTIILDVREPGEYADGFVPGATNVPRGLLEFRIADIEALESLSDEQRLQTPIVVYCRSGSRAALAADTLQNMGYRNVRSLEGGFKGWKSQNLPIAHPAD